MKSLNLQQIAEVLGLDPTKYPDNININGISTLQDSTPEMISFITGEKYKKQLSDSKAAAFIVPLNTQLENKIIFPMEEVWEGVLKLLNEFYPPPSPSGVIEPKTQIAKNARFGKNVTVMQNVQIGNNVTIGDNVIIESNCVVEDNVRIENDVYIYHNVTLLRNIEIGNRVTIHPGVVIGSDGFKYEIIRGKRTKIPQVGTVIIEDDVEIGANTCIDRASFTATRIGAGTKVDNLVHIAHNVEIGKNCLIMAQVGIAGSSKIGDNVILAGQVGVKDNIRIGDGAIVGAKGGVTKDIKAGEYVWGIPAIPMKQFSKLNALIHKLPELFEKIKKIKEKK